MLQSANFLIWSSVFSRKKKILITTLPGPAARIYDHHRDIPFSVYNSHQFSFSLITHNTPNIHVSYSYCFPFLYSTAYSANVSILCFKIPSTNGVNNCMHTFTYVSERKEKQEQRIQYKKQTTNACKWSQDTRHFIRNSQLHRTLLHPLAHKPNLPPIRHLQPPPQTSRPLNTPPMNLLMFERGHGECSPTEFPLPSELVGGQGPSREGGVLRGDNDAGNPLHPFGDPGLIFPQFPGVF